ncbi:MAG: thioredoxin domain-containing protein [Acidobacteriota bacterium]
MKRMQVSLMTSIITFAVIGLASAASSPNGQQDPGAVKDRPAGQSAAPPQSKPAAQKEADCGCDAKAPQDVLALVNGVKVAVKDVDEPLKDRVHELQNQVIEARKRQLDLEINSRLLEAEAKRLGITPDALLEREVSKNVTAPTEAEARAFYDQNKSRVQGEFNDIKDQIISYLQSQRQQDEAKKLAGRLRGRAQVKVLAASVTPPEADADRARVFATVNGKPVTSGDVEDALKPLIFSVQEQVYYLRKTSLEVKINDLLLAGEAKKRNMTTEALFDAEVLPRVKPVTEEVARKFYEENKGRLQGSFDKLRPQIVDYLQKREQGKAAEAYAEQLRKGATVQVYLKLPEPPVFDIPIEDRPWKGGVNATVTIVEFTDYECPSCAATQPILEEVAKEFGDKVKLVVRSYPLDQHKHAFKAAEAAEAAREQGKFWEYSALLFTNQTALEVDKLKEYASQLGLDRKKFDAALDSGKFVDRVKRDVADGDKIGVDSTPTVFINGKRAPDKSREALKTAIEAALKDRAKK